MSGVDYVEAVSAPPVVVGSARCLRDLSRAGVDVQVHVPDSAHGLSAGWDIRVGDEGDASAGALLVRLGVAFRAEGDSEDAARIEAWVSSVARERSTLRAEGLGASDRASAAFVWGAQWTDAHLSDSPDRTRFNPVFVGAALRGHRHCGVTAGSRRDGRARDGHSLALRCDLGGPRAEPDLRRNGSDSDPSSAVRVPPARLARCGRRCRALPSITNRVGQRHRLIR